MRYRAVPLLLLCCLGCSAEQRWVDLGDVPVEGGVIRGCRLGYRTFGRLDDRASNAVLLVPWFLGTSRELGREVGRSGLVDPARFFVVAVDAPGNGVSCSPSNSTVQPGSTFPRLGIPDLATIERRLVTDVLGVRRLRAVVGISMGGMQALAWATSAPESVEGVVSIVGSPRATDQDRQSWESAVARIRGASRWKRAAGALGRLAPLQALYELRANPEDFALQAEAMRRLDLTVAAGGSLRSLADRMQPRLLLVVSMRDEVVDPAPARELAELTGAELVVLDDRCGHAAMHCERERITGAVRRFLDALP